MHRPLLRSTFALAACALALGCAPPARPPTAGHRDASHRARASISAEPAPRAEPGAWVSACQPGSPEHRAAEAKLVELDAMVNRLRPADDPKPALAAITAALSSGCFRVSAGDEPSLEADSGLALKAWWNDQGGRWWVAHYLDLKSPRDSTGRPSSVVAPTMRRTLTRETRPGHPLFELLCAADDPKCGAEIEGFRERAEYAFRGFATAKHAAWLDSERQDAPPESITTCVAKALAPPADERYVAWRACLLSASRPRARLPLGPTKAPRRGWLVLRGRRGHYSFCDEVRAYDLATGAAYVAQSCSELALQSGGSVDGARTDAGRKSETHAGHVSTEALREAAWMTLFAAEVQPDVQEAWGYALPEGVEPKVPESGSGRGLGFSFSTSSAQTSLAWGYIVDGKTIASGTLTWPENYNDAALEHAVQLLRFAESTLRPGCPAALPPPLDRGAATPGVSPLDADPTSLRSVGRGLAAALAGARKTACSGRSK